MRFAFYAPDSKSISLLNREKVGERKGVLHHLPTIAHAGKGERRGGDFLVQALAPFFGPLLASVMIMPIIASVFPANRIRLSRCFPVKQSQKRPSSAYLPRCTVRPVL